MPLIGYNDQKIREKEGETRETEKGRKKVKVKVKVKVKQHHDDDREERSAMHQITCGALFCAHWCKNTIRFQ